jgi:adenylyltransferase/sulfurtransferase
MARLAASRDWDSRLRGLPELGSDELQRYGRHLVLPDVGLEGQRRLKAGRVLLVGAGGLGSPVALYLAAAGVGTLGLVDFDVVDLSNLQRQVLHGTSDVGRSKLDSARDRIHDVNPHVAVDTYEMRLTSANALDILSEYDVVVDGTDNFATRYLTNDACVLVGKPNVYGSIFRFEGQASVFATETGPCYRCLYPDPPPPGLVGIGDPLVGRLLLIDALGSRFRTVQLARDPACPACGTREIRELIDYDAFCGGARPTGTEDPSEVTPSELAQRVARGDALDIIDVREHYEWQIARIPGAHLIPLGTLHQALSSLDPRREIVVYCHHGIRSAHAAEQLRAAGFTRVWNLAGGIDRWTDDVDASVPRY